MDDSRHLRISTHAIVFRAHCADNQLLAINQLVIILRLDCAILTAGSSVSIDGPSAFDSSARTAQSLVSDSSVPTAQSLVSN